MLHAPTRDNQKVNNGARAPAAQEPERILHPPYGRHEQRYSAVTGAAGGLGSSRNHWRSADAQQAYGNQAVLQTLSHKPAKQPLLQRRGVGNGNMEPKPEPVAEVEMRLAEPRLQRKCGCGGDSGGECAECKKREEGTLRRRRAGRADPSGVPPIVHEVLRSPGQPLPASVRTQLEPRFGQDFSPVRIHTDPQAAKSAVALNAEAYTVGRHVVFGPGRCRPETPDGLHLIAHELAHSIQQGMQASSLQKSLTVGEVGDPDEAAADKAADAALRSAPSAPLGRSGPVIRRRWVRAPGMDPDNRVAWDDADPKVIYHVTRKTEIKPHTKTSWCPPDITAGADHANVWVRVSWCRGTQGKAEIGANVPQELQNLMRDLLQAVTSGGNAEDVIKNAKLTPYVNFDIAKSGSWKISIGGHATVGRQGVTGGGGQVEVSVGKYGSFGVQGDVQSLPGGKTEGSVKGTWTYQFGGPPKFDCPTQEQVTLVQVVKFECQKEEHVPPPKRPDSRTRYIYFKWSKKDLNYSLEGDLTGENLDALRKDLEEGYRVSAITGYTSPEGPMKAGPGFEGNISLAKERADAAKDQVLQICKGIMGLRAIIEGKWAPASPFSAEPPNVDSCFVGGANAVVPLRCDQVPGEPCVGGELFTGVAKGPKGKELEGKQLAAVAVPGFEGAEGEAAQKTPEFTKQYEKARTLEEKTELIYPKLRRAKIELTGERALKKGEPGYETDTKLADVPCPPGIVDAAFPEEKNRKLNEILNNVIPCPKS
ncbi:MAG TPA: DUF4157 domain-containing protein [Terriglobia bacterium]|nr:DUF4157 domain-containing protein [Terriglobia bacterium]